MMHLAEQVEPLIRPPPQTLLDATSETDPRC